MSAVVDLIQSEYGWSDERVLELPVCRLRQIARSIEDRLKAVSREHRDVVDLQTRAVVTFIAGTVRVEKGKRNHLLEQANKFKLFADSADPSGVQSTDSVDRPEVFVEQGSQVADNRPGSFEALMQGFRVK